MPDSTLPRIALVTGGAQRIGRSVALMLAARGWDVAVHFLTSGEAANGTVSDIIALGRRAVALRANLADGDEVAGLLARCAQTLGEVRLVVNNASRFVLDGAADFSMAMLDEHMHTNLAAPVILARELHARMPRDAQGETAGVVVNILDQKVFNPNPDFLSYTLSKAALGAATDLLARALAPRVRVVGVAPGLTLPWKGDDGTFGRAQASAPLGRGSAPEDIAQAVCYLAGAHSVTGTTLIVDGGQHLQPSSRDVMFLARDANR